LTEVPGDGGSSVGRGGCCRGGCFLRARECSCAGAGESGWMARLIPLTVDGLIYASSMAMFDSARRASAFPLWRGGCCASASRPPSRRTWPTAWGTVWSAAASAWPAVALVGSYELLMVIICGAQVPPGSGCATNVPQEDPLYEPAARVFADELAAARVPSVVRPCPASCRAAAGAARTRASISG
jgi:Protein of unknown function (DUF2637)